MASVLTEGGGWGLGQRAPGGGGTLCGGQWEGGVGGGCKSRGLFTFSHSHVHRSRFAHAV